MLANLHHFNLTYSPWTARLLTAAITIEFLLPHLENQLVSFIQLRVPLFVLRMSETGSSVVS